jgi:predicted aldo/keto reductase-like oxidoreductase
MQYRTVPKTGDQLSILGFGCMRLPVLEGKIDRDKAAKLLMHSIDQGVNYIDTAVPYHHGECESFLGKFLEEHQCRNRIKLATKLPRWQVYTYRDMEAIFTAQLERLRTDHIDYYLLHGIDGPSWEKLLRLGILKFLDKIREEGRIRYAGFSYHGNRDDFSSIVDAYDWPFCQIQYNYLDTHCQAGTQGLEYAAGKDLAVIIMEPLRGGKLAAPFPVDTQATSAYQSHFNSPAEWALRWLWDRPEITCVLSGMTEQGQLHENLETASNAEAHSFGPQEHALIDQVKNLYQQQLKVNCTACSYCMPCPAGIDIPGCFEMFNNHHLSNNGNGSRNSYLARFGGVTRKASYASLCNKCRKCEQICPQHLAIPDLLQEVANDLEGKTFRLKRLVAPLYLLLRRLKHMRLKRG